MRQTIIENTETVLYGYEQYVNRETWVTIFTVTVNKVIFFSTIIAWFVRDIWHKYLSRCFKIVSNFTRLTAREITYNNFETSLVVFMPNITTNHAVTYRDTYVTLGWISTDAFLAPHVNARKF